MLFAKDVSLSGTTSLNGGTGGGGGGNIGNAGGGAGGSCLIVCKTATLGTNKITVAAGDGGGKGLDWPAGDGAVGRIAVHHSGAITGITSPTFTDTTDISLIEFDTAFIMAMI
jgi:hypothetical protein